MPSNDRLIIAEILAHPEEVDAQAAGFDRDDQELEEKEKEDNEKDEDFQPSSQQTEASSCLDCSQDSNASAENEIQESSNRHQRVAKRVDPEAEYIPSSQGSDSGSDDSDSDQEQEPQGTKTQLFLPSSPLY